VDAGLYLFHNAAERIRRGTAPYLYLPKLQSAAEAGLWHDVFVQAEAELGAPAGSIRTTVLIETIHAAFAMDEILHALGPFAAGLNAGRWDYLFSCIKTFRGRADRILPERAQLTMTTPFMRAYTELLVRTCHRRGAHAIGGMAAFIPSRRDAAVNEAAMARVRDDKERESRDGFDGTWVAHPDLVPLAMEIFDGVLGDRPNQKDRQRPDVRVSAADLLDFAVPGGRVTESGVRLNVSVALQYLDAWLAGNGPEQVPTNRIPSFHKWKPDVGVGLDAGQIGVYDEGETFYGDPGAVFKRYKELRVGVLRVNLYWGGKLGVAKTRPFQASDPRLEYAGLARYWRKLGDERHPR